MINSRKFRAVFCWITLCLAGKVVGDSEVKTVNGAFQMPITTVPCLSEGSPMIGAWNLRLLPPPAFMRPGDYHDPILIARIIEATSVPLWALLELFDHYEDSHEQLRNEYLDAAVLILNRRTGGDWQYWIGNAKDRFGQNPGFLWDATEVSLVLEPEIMLSLERPILEATGHMQWRRRPAQAVFRFERSEVTCRLVAAHQKGYDTAETQLHRLDEVEALLHSLAETDQSVKVDQTFILGRLAEASDEAAAQMLKQADFRDLNVADTPNLMRVIGDNAELEWAPMRIFSRSESELKLYPSDQLTYGDAWLADLGIDLPSYLYYVSNYLPVATCLKSADSVDQNSP